MGRRTVSMKHKAAYGVTLSEILIVLVIIGIVTAILFPVFQKGEGDYRPTGRVLDGFGKPLSGATLRFRDASGRLVATITADGQGEFRRAGLRDLSRNTISGFALTRFLHRTGGSDIYTFTPLGTQIVIVQDESGKIVAGFTLAIGADPRTWQAPPQSAINIGVTDKKGAVQIPNVPIGARLKLLSQDPHYAIDHIQTIVSPDTIKYVATVSAPATIAGQVLSTGGRPLSGYKPFATLGPDIEHHDRHYARWLVTGAAGRFEINGLPPGTYYVRAALAHGYQAVTPVQRVVVVSGQRVAVNLRATAPAQAP